MTEVRSDVQWCRLVQVSQSMVNWSAGNKGAWIEFETLEGSVKLVRTYAPVRSEGELRFKARDLKGHEMNCIIRSQAVGGMNVGTLEVSDWGEDIPLDNL